ncbi:MAG: hypothetical protein Ta2A_10020 [Treponemataceae bacterium]|nr:MAG: hypothetical protein Ta2A_10020 [Treponemataceae bacterium]
MASGKVTQIDTNFADQCNNDHVLSPDGMSIAVSHHTWEDGQSRIYKLPLAGGKPELITPIAPSYLHGWSPDGKTLAYCAERNGQYDVFTIPVTGGIETQLTNEVSLDDGPEYSPCGKYIWFNSTRSALMQIWRMDADGANPVQITKDEANNWFAHLSPNGKRAVYISYKKGDVEPNSHPPNKNVAIRMFSVDDAENGINDLVTLAEFFGGQGSLNVNSWSPDNKTIAFVSYRKK